jgi:hypothetical protein
MTKMWRVIALAVLLLGIAGILRLYWVGFVWKNGLSLETAVVLFVGLIAFLAVMVQIEEERIKRFEEQERDEATLAKAIAYELDSFYMRHLDRSLQSKLFESWDRMKSDLKAVEVFKPVVGNPFVVYESSADKLGVFEARITMGVICSYSACSAFVEVMKLYERARDSNNRLLAEKLQGAFRESAEQALQLAFITCKVLCSPAGIDFSSLSISKESESQRNSQVGVGPSLQRATADNSAPGKNAQTH